MGEEARKGGIPGPGGSEESDRWLRELRAVRLVPTAAARALAIAFVIGLFWRLLPPDAGARALWTVIVAVGFSGMAMGHLRSRWRELLAWEEVEELQDRRQEARKEARRELARLEALEGRLVGKAVSDPRADARLEEARRLGRLARERLEPWPESALEEARRAVAIAEEELEEAPPR